MTGSMSSIQEYSQEATRMYVVITGTISNSNDFFGPFDNREEAESWAREYSIQHARPVEVVWVLPPFDL